MIFKTFDSNIDKISSKWGMFGRSFNDIGTAIVGKIQDINKNFQATDDLFASIKNSDSIWKRLYPSKESIQSQLIDIDKLYPQKSDENFSSLLTKLVKIDSQVSSGTKTWKSHFDRLEEGEKWQIEFVQNTDLQKASLTDVKKAYESARKSALAHNEAIKAQTFSAKAGTVALKALSIAGNMAIAWGVTQIISGIVKFVDNLHTTLKEQQEITEDLSGELSVIQSDISDVNSELETTSNRIDELNAKESLSFVEKEELKNLIITNDELQRKNKLLAEQETYKQKEIADSVRKEFNKEYGRNLYSKIHTQTELDEIAAKETRYDELHNKDYAIKTAKDYNEEVKLLEEINALYAADSIPSSFEEHIQETIRAYDDLNKRKMEGKKFSESEQKQLEEYREYLVNTVSDLEEYKNRYGVDDTISQSWSNLINSAYENLYPAQYVTEKFNDVFDKLSPTVQSELKKLAQNGSLSVDSLSDDIKNKFAAAGFSATETVEQISASFGNLNESIPSSPALSFTDAFNSADFADSKEKLLELAKSGELTPETIESTEDYAKLLKDTGISAKEAAAKILDMLSVQEKLTGASNGIEKLKSSYNEFKDLGFVTASSLESLPDAFKKLKGYDLFSEIAGDPTQGQAKIQQAFNDIVKEYLTSQGTLFALKNASDSDIQTYIANLEQTGISNADEVVYSALESWEDTKNEIVENVDDATEEIEGLTDEELQNYVDALNEKGTDTADVYSQIGQASAKLHGELGEQYQTDLFNYVNALSEKKRLYNEWVTAVNAGTASGSTYSSTEGYKSDDERQAYLKKQIETEILKKKLEDDVALIKTNFEVEFTGEKDSSESKTKSNTIIDWMERKVEVLSNSIDLLKSKLQNAFTVKKKNSIIDDEIKKSKELLNTYSKAQSKYSSAASSYAKKHAKVLTKSMIQKIQSGNYDISEYDSDTANIINTYKDYWDKSKNAEKSYQDTSADIRSLKEEKNTNKQEYADGVIAALEAQKESATTAKKKNKYLKDERKYIKDSYNAQIANAKLEKDTYLVKKLKAELDQKLLDNQKEQNTNIQDEADKRISLLEAQKESATTAKKKNTYLEKEREQIQKSYEAQIANAKLEKDSVTTKKLQYELNQKLLDISIEQYRNRQEEADAKKELYATEAELCVSAKDRNNYISKQITQLAKSYDYQIKIARAQKDATKATQLQAEALKEIITLQKQKSDNLQSETDLGISTRDLKAENAKAKNGDVKTIAEAYESDAKALIDTANEISKTDPKTQTAKAMAKIYGKGTDFYERTSFQLNSYGNGRLDKNVINDVNSALYNGGQITKEQIDAIRKVNSSLADKLEAYKEQWNSANSELESYNENLVQQDIKAAREKQIAAKQVYADSYEESYNLNKQLEANATTASEKNKYEKKALGDLKEQYRYLIEIAKIEGNVTEVERLRAELQEKVRESYLTQFQNIEEEYDYHLQSIEHSMNQLDSKIAQAQAKGLLNYRAYYEQQGTEYGKQLETQKKKLKDLKEDAAKYITQGGDINDSTFKQMQADIWATEEAIEATTTAQMELNNTIRDLDWSNFQWVQGQINEIAEDAQSMIDVLSHSDLTKSFDIDGSIGKIEKWSDWLTDEGTATMQEYTRQIEAYERQAQNYYKNANEYMQKYYKTDDTKYLELAQEAGKTADGMVKSALDAKDSIVNIMSDVYGSWKDAISNIISKYEESLDAQKNLYDYQNSIQEKTDAISSLKKQYAALSGNETEENQSSLQKLATQIKEAEKDLEETEYDQYISDQKKMLDHFQDDLEEWIGNYLDNTNGILSDIYEYLSTEEARKIIVGVENDNYATDLGYDKSSYTLGDSVDEVEKNANSVIGITRATDDTFLAKLNDLAASGLMDMDALREMAGETLMGRMLIPNQAELNVIGQSSEQNYVNIEIGDIFMNGVNDPETFAKNLKNVINSNPSVQNVLRSQTIDMTLKGHNSLSSYRW